MTRWIAASLILALLGGCACSRRRAAAEQALVQEEEPFNGLASFEVADPRAQGQLLAGWHEVEQGSWRWTEKHFAVALKTPAKGKAATLKLQFALPKALLARLASITLAATINGTALAPQTYRKPGEQVYARSVPGEALNAEAVRVDFLLDKTLPPDERDKRELGVVVSSVGLE
ncbi:MAG TPA: hypothetical protein VEU62_20370 [Bryobacterales bacterium]|nr:hypothetical protein [Bryobacterales bacterium]